MNTDPKDGGRAMTYEKEQSNKIKHEQATFLHMLVLNAYQMEVFLEDKILDNPFLEIEYSSNPLVRQLNNKQERAVTDTLPLNHSLEAHLFEQILLYRKTPIRDAMVELVKYLDDRGFLPYTIQELAERLEVPEIIVLDAVTLFKQLEPAGIGAFDLREAWMIQTELDQFAPIYAYDLLEHDYEALMSGNYATILEEGRLSEEDITTALEYFYSLQQNPAALFEETESYQLIPDLAVSYEDEKRLKLTYNQVYYPSLIFKEAYYEEMLAYPDEETHAYVEQQKEKAEILFEEIEKRQELLIKLGHALVDAQAPFFKGEVNYPLSLSVAELSEATQLSEAFVYRLLSNKTLEFKQNMYPLFDFINVSTRQMRDGFTSYEIKERIMQLIENSPKDLTNEEITTLLEEENILINPVIVQNYRETKE